jgi:glycosyltransferase involved in cell wall biosynthesis
MDKKTVLFLYTEFSSYLESCLNFLINNNAVNVCLIRYAVNDEAPFDFKSLNFKNFSREEFNSKKEMLDFALALNPQLVVVSGWIDKDYLYVALKLKKKCITVMAMDTPWSGSIKQIFLSKLCMSYFSKRFNYVWVPGLKQRLFAKKIGFSDSHIFDGFYSGNVDLFEKYYEDSIHLKRKVYPKVFLFLGRYINNKSIHELCAAFQKTCFDYDHDWELWCVGAGEEWDKRIKHPKIKHFGFLQPNELYNVISKSGIYILPSKFEPWGVSLHEFVSAGFPIIASKNVGSAEIFLKNNINGLLLDSCSKVDIYQTLLQMMKMSREELLVMSEESLILSKKITPKLWADKITSLL